MSITNQGETSERMFLGIFLFLLVVLIIPASARAQDCEAGIEMLENQYGLSGDAPSALKPPTPEDLSESGGVIEPPATGDPAVIEPGVAAEEAPMPVVPESSPPPEADVPGLSASEIALLETLLVAARSEAERGNEAQCFNRLDQVADLLARSGDD